MKTSMSWNMKVKKFPATLDGLGSAVAWKYLYPSSKILLVGKVDDALKKFTQIGNFEINFKEEELESPRCETSRLLVKIQKKQLNPSIEDMKLFAFVIYSKTKALLDPITDEDDALALAFCIKSGLNLGSIMAEFSEKVNLLAKDIMTSLVTTVKVGMNISDVKKVIDKTGLTGLPVVDEENHAIGMVTKKDLDRAIKSGIDDLSLVMSIPVITVKGDDQVHKIGELMAIHDVGRIVVVDDDQKVIGIITRRDLVRAIVSTTMEYHLVWNMIDKMKKTLSSKLFSMLKEIGEFAFSRGEKIYAVGGFVRDLIMGTESLDIDTVVEGDGIEMAKTFANFRNVRCLTYPEFGTATIKLNGISIDFATARTEYYEVPGALPKVERSNLRRDLYRRDFTINAMAIDLTPDNFGMMIDFFGGMEDIRNKKIRVLHSLSFVEDPTRILRALRYAARFDYELSSNTESLLLTAIKNGYLFSVTPSRIRSEFERSIEDEKASKIFEFYQQYGILKVLYCESNINFSKFFTMAKMDEFVKLNKLYAIFLLILKNCQFKRSVEIIKLYGMPSKFVNALSSIQNDEFISSIVNPKSNFDLYILMKSLPIEAVFTLAYDERTEKSAFKYLDELSKITLKKVNGALLKEKYKMDGMDIKHTLEKITEMKMNFGMDEEEALKKIIGDAN
jgi:tRNA nucleotidyltransferase (CCA-adding enzyme)